MFYKYPELLDRPLYLFGESYAGMYIPALANYIIRANNPIIQLSGIGIGNGWTDPIIQIGAHNHFLYKNKKLNVAQFLYYAFYTIYFQL